MKRKTSPALLCISQISSYAMLSAPFAVHELCLVAAACVPSARRAAAWYEASRLQELNGTSVNPPPALVG